MRHPGEWSDNRSVEVEDLGPRTCRTRKLDKSHVRAQGQARCEKQLTIETAQILKTLTGTASSSEISGLSKNTRDSGLITKIDVRMGGSALQTATFLDSLPGVWA